MPLNILTNFEIQKYHQNQPKFNGVYSINNSAKIKDGAYVINLDECTLTTLELSTVQKKFKNS